MLYMSTINATLPLAEKLVGKQIVLSAVEGTPLSMLVDRTYSPRLDMNEGEVAEMINAASLDTDPSEINQHNNDISDLIAAVGDSVQRTLNGARNVAAPIYRGVAEQVEELVERNKLSLLNPIQVKPVYYHAVWNSPVLEGLVGRYSEQPVLGIEMPASLPMLSEEAIEAYLKVGNGSFDDEIMSVVDGGDDTWLTGLYSNVFTAEGRGYDYVMEILTGKHKTRNELLCLHLFARRLMQDPPEGVRQSISEYRSTMGTLVNQSGRAVARLMQLRQREFDKKLLVYSYPAAGAEKAYRAGSTIHVNGELYNRWVEEGGSPECLYGALFDDRDTTYAGLLDKSADYERLWERQRRLITMRVSYQEKVVKMEAFQEAMTAAINTLEDDALLVERGEYHSRLKQSMKTVTEKELDTVYHTARRLVCDVLFPHTQYKQVLEAIDRACDANPELEVREAALLATVEYVVDWIAQFVVVERDGGIAI